MKYLVVFFFAACGLTAAAGSARDLNERGLAAYARGDYGAAEHLYRDAIPQWEALGNGYTAHLAITRMNLGDALAAQGRRSEAIPEFERSLALFRRSLGAQDPRALDCMNALASTALILGDTARAAPLIGEALAAERKLFPEGTRLAHTLAAQATLLLHTGRAAEALEPAQEALRISLQSAGPDSLDAALAYTVVAEAHRTANRPARALPLYERARIIYQKRLGPEHPRVAALLSQEALLAADDGNFATAVQDLEQARSILDHSCPGCAYERWTADCNLAQIRTRQGRYGEAGRLLTQALALAERFGASSGADVEQTRRMLDQVNQKAQREEKADRGRHAGTGAAQ